MEIQNFKLVSKGFVLARCDILIKAWGGLCLKEVTVFEKNGTRWITPPQREFKTPEGKRGFVSLVTFDPETFKKLQDSALAKIEEYVKAPPQQLEPQEENGYPF